MIETKRRSTILNIVLTTIILIIGFLFWPGKEKFNQSNPRDVNKTQVKIIVKALNIEAMRNLIWNFINNYLKDFDINKYQDEYTEASPDSKEDTYLGEFINGAMAHKSMVCDRIYRSGNLLAGFVRND